MKNENIKNYIAEVIRLFIILFSFYLMNNFLSWLPFISEITSFRKIPLATILSLIISILAIFIVIEFAKRTSTLIDSILSLVPQAGKLYSLIIYSFLTLFLYSAAYNITFNFLGEDWIWIYQSVFIAVTLFLLSKAGLLIYRNSTDISRNLVELFSSKKNYF